MRGDHELPPLRDHELEDLIQEAPPALRTKLARLCAEVRTLRDQAAEREHAATQEIEY